MTNALDVEQPRDVLEAPDTMLDRRRRPLAPLVEAVGVAAVTLAAFCVVYRPWGDRLRIPFSYGQDSVAYAMFVKTIRTTGSYHATDLLGAPHGQEMYDFPQGAERLHLVLLRVLTWFSSDAYLVLNVSYLLGFVLIALCAHFVLRTLGARPIIAGAAALLFAFLPYHFWHGEQHAFLSSYYAVPLAVLMAVWALDGELPLTPSRLKAAWRGGQRGRLLVIALSAVVLGSASPYYAVFAVLLIAAAGGIAFLRLRSWSSVLAAAVLVIAIGGVLLANIMPELLYRRSHGTNLEVANRPLSEGEAFGLHITQLLLPHPGHRIDLFDRLGQRGYSGDQSGEGGISLGIIGVVGLALGAAGLIGRRLGRFQHDAIPRLGAVALASVLIGTMGGLGFTLAVFGFTQIRVWARIAIVIGFCALAIVALAAERVLEAPWWRSRRGLGVAAIALVTVIGLADQIPSNATPDYDAIEAVYRSDQAFFTGMEAELPDGAMVFQLPVIPFPETPPVNLMGSYDHMRGYIFGSGKLKWSAGGMRGRESDWQDEWMIRPLPNALDGLAAAGFAAVYVDDNGYLDRGVSINASLKAELGDPVASSGNARMHWYDLRARAAALRAVVGSEALGRAGAAVVNMPKVEYGESISILEQGPTGPFRWMGESGLIEVTNHGDARDVVVSLFVVGPGGHLTVEAPDGTKTTVVPSAAGAPAQVRFRLPTGTSQVLLSTDVPAKPTPDDSRDLRVRLVTPSVLPADIAETLG